METYLEVQGEFGAIGVKTVTDGVVHRRVLMPGSFVGGEFVPSNLSGEPEDIQALATETWTPEIVAAWRGLLLSQKEADEVPVRYLVPKRVIVDRLHDAGLLDAAYAALNAADLYTRERWNTRTDIFADDPTALAVLATIGGDPAVIFAPV